MKSIPTLSVLISQCFIGGFTFACQNYLVLSGGQNHLNNTYVCIIRAVKRPGEEGNPEKGLYITVKNEKDVQAEVNIA